MSAGTHNPIRAQPSDLAQAMTAPASAVATPRPMTFFSWIVGLATAVVVLFPFSTSAPLSEKVATAAVDLVIGVAIGSLINGVGARSMRRRRTGGGYPAAPSGDWQETSSGAYPRRPL